MFSDKKKAPIQFVTSAVVCASASKHTQPQTRVKHKQIIFQMCDS